MKTWKVSIEFLIIFPNILPVNAFLTESQFPLDANMDWIHFGDFNGYQGMNNAYNLQRMHITEDYLIAFQADCSQQITNSSNQILLISISFPTLNETFHCVSLVETYMKQQINTRSIIILIEWPNDPSTNFSSPCFLQNTKELQLKFRNFTLEEQLYVYCGIQGSKMDKPFNEKYFHVFYANNILSYNEVKSLRVITGNCDCRLPLHGVTANGQILKFAASEETDIYINLKNGTTLEAADMHTPSIQSKYLKFLQEKFDLNFQFVNVSNMMTKYSNGSWSGWIRNVSEGSIDLGFSTTIMKPSKAKLIAYLPPSGDDVLCAIFSDSEDFGSNYIRDVFVNPFQNELWFVAIATWITLALSMVFFSWIRKRLNCEQDHEEPDFTNDAFLFTCATVTQQGWDEHPHCTSLRTLFLCASISGVIVFAGYSAAIVSTLTTEASHIHEVDQLFRRGVEVGVIEKLDWNLSDVNLPAKLKKLSKINVYKAHEGYKLLQKKPFALISTESVFFDAIRRENINDSQICEVHKISFMHERLQQASFTGKSMKYRDLLKIAYEMFREYGILSRLRSALLYKKRCLHTGESKKGRPLGLHDVFTAFMILVAGYFLSILILVIEIFFKRKIKDETKKKQKLHLIKNNESPPVIVSKFTKHKVAFELE